MAQTDDDLLRQVEEELRRERLEKIWKQYGTYILAAAALIVVGVGGYKIWDGRRIAAAQASGETYESALLLLNDKKDGSAEKEFEKLAGDGVGGYRALAQLQLAGLQAKQGKKAEALATYDALASSSNGDVVLREFAQLQAAGLRIGAVDFTEIENRLTPLMTDTGAWRFSARELLGLAAYKAGKTTEARSILTPLFVDQQTPQGIAERAQIIMAEIASGEIAKKAAEAPASAPAPSATPPADATAPPAKKD
ncbi:MAG: tetratricopeptide repeat protein [Hyphomicrobium sp.]